MKIRLKILNNLYAIDSTNIEYISKTSYAYSTKTYSFYILFKSGNKIDITMYDDKTIHNFKEKFRKMHYDLCEAYFNNNYSGVKTIEFDDSKENDTLNNNIKEHIQENVIDNN